MENLDLDKKPSESYRDTVASGVKEIKTKLGKGEAGGVLKRLEADPLFSAVEKISHGGGEEDPSMTFSELFNGETNDGLEKVEDRLRNNVLFSEAVLACGSGQEYLQTHRKESQDNIEQKKRR